MPENKFEKKVHQEMQGFRLKPSPDVWPKIEERIREKKKRRLILIFFLFGGLAILGYWQRHLLFFEKPASVSTSKTQVTNKTPVPHDPAYPQSSEENKTKPSEKKSVLLTQQPSGVNKKLNETVKRTIPSQNIPEQEQKIIPNRFNNVLKQQKDIRVSAMPDSISIMRTEKATYITDSAAVAPAIIINPVAEKVISEKMPDTVASKAAGKPNDMSALLHPSNDSLNISVRVDSTKNKKDRKQKTKKWEWAGYVTPGIVSVNEALFSFTNTRRAENVSGFPAGGSSGTPGGGSNNIPAGPSASSGGFSLQSGATLKKQLHKQTFFSVSIQYAYYSEKIKVGNNRDSVLRYVSQYSFLSDARSAYGAAAPTKNFINRYHFIELPVSLQFPVNRNRNRPVIWHIGFKAGRLIAANVLAYDTSFGGIYYDNKRWINQSQVSVFSGLGWPVFTKSKFQWIIGPHADLHLSRLSHNPQDRNKYLFFAGLKTAILFNNKK